jgi:hypothetical protein
MLLHVLHHFFNVDQHGAILCSCHGISSWAQRCTAHRDWADQRVAAAMPARIAPVPVHGRTQWEKLHQVKGELVDTHL